MRGSFGDITNEDGIKDLIKLELYHEIMRLQIEK